MSAGNTANKKITIMKIELTNKQQKTTTIDGKTYTAERVIRDFFGEAENRAGNKWVSDSLELQVADESVTLRDVSGNFTILSR